MTVWLRGQNPEDFREHFAIYFSTTGNSKSDFLDEKGNLKEGVVTLVPETEVTNDYLDYGVDLSAHNGKTGYIAIRHFNCYDQYLLLLDDFSIYNENAVGPWTTVSGDSPTTIEGLTPNTEYQYQVEYQFNDNTFYTQIATLTTLDDNIAPTDLSATAITANTANISWTGFGDSYNLRYSQGGQSKVTLSVPSDICGNGIGYQMLLDKDHNTYGTVIPKTGGLTISGNASSETYANFEYKIPENADGAMNTTNVIDGKKVKEITITIPAGIYDWCITNPTPNDRVWIASKNGNVGGRQNDFVFEAGKHYTFTVTYDASVDNDCVNMTAIDDASLTTSSETSVPSITSTSYAMSGLNASTDYTVYVQSVKGDKTSEWSSIGFTTLKAGELYLYNDEDNSGIITNNNGKKCKVTLSGRTLYKDGSWNTLCLPFPVSVSEGTLAGATVMELDADGTHDDHQTGLAPDGTLYLYFKSADAIVAGKPYIVKWESGDPIENPVFNGVTIDKDATTTVTAANSGYHTIQFIGTYDLVPLTANGKSNLYLGAGNTLYYPSTAMNINTCRAYFHVDLTGNVNAVRAMVLSFDDSEETGISDVLRLNDKGQMINDEWFTLDGRRLDSKPKVKGLYINNGHKVLIQ